MELDGSLPCSQEPSTGPYPEPYQSSPFLPILPFLWSILILSTHLRLRLPSDLFPSGFPTNIQNKTRLMISSYCLCMCVRIPRINFWMSGSVFKKLGMYIMAPEAISTAYFINPSHQSLCLYINHLIVARQRLSKKRYRCNEYISNNTGIVGDVVFYAVRVLSKENRWSVLSITFCFKQSEILTIHR
jgi:hypothetical protein